MPSDTASIDYIGSHPEGKSRHIIAETGNQPEGNIRHTIGKTANFTHTPNKNPQLQLNTWPSYTNAYTGAISTITQGKSFKANKYISPLITHDVVSPKNLESPIYVLELTKDEKAVVFTHKNVAITTVKKLRFIDKTYWTKFGIWEYDSYIIQKIPKTIIQTPKNTQHLDPAHNNPHQLTQRPTNTPYTNKTQSKIEMKPVRCTESQ